MKIRRPKLKADNSLFHEILRDVCLTTRVIESGQFIQHGNTSVLEHSILVAYVSYRVALKLKLPVKHRELIRGALLHDYFLYDWHEKDKNHRLHGFYHPFTALRNAERDVKLTAIERDIIKKHMFPLTLIPPRHMESLLVCLVDKFCATCETLYITSRDDKFWLKKAVVYSRARNRVT
ncbi:phosphohydrolase [Anaerocolumna cellulosilytica]|uniref:Phosphohydrolase n=1 Tax=Anaerocolumna cellulosilytica TaxID=433286 RepID=A0A6S6QRI2_9FIRM|nr:HD domain-containing protein [Anaerocolumna cellulosilytica]MBB5197641.1 uncharacterized protein [Anaerocolumna cellulosilytica]BCJ93214.1 phosphohydrolase [Anaerocolumna cellulosilytica]